MKSQTTYGSTDDNDNGNGGDDESALLVPSTVETGRDDDGAENNINFVPILLPLAFIGLIDAISFMIVAPSLSFYIIDTMGGSKELYGLVLSTFSFASFLFKPVLGYWCDSNGSKFRTPYCVSMSAAAIGGLLYFLASAFIVQHSEGYMDLNNSSKIDYIGISLILIGRFLGGMGAANSTLGFTYIALVIPHNQMTKASSILSTVRIVGMALGPIFSLILAKLQYTVQIFGAELELTHLNAVGLVLFVGNFLSILVLYYNFEEPSEVLPKLNPNGRKNTDDNTEKHLAHETSSVIDDKIEFWKSVFTLEVLIPIFMIFALNANFQLIETALAPAAEDALDWGPVQVSSVFSFNAILMFAVILTTFQLSAMGVLDMTFLIVGETISAIGYFLLYFFWKQNAAVWQFIVPLVASISCFPLLGAPSRTIYTEIIASKPLLRNHQGTMQAYMSMSASVAGFVAPGFIASYVLRTPDVVAASNDQRELTPWALLAPFFSLVSLLGVLWLRRKDNLKREALLLTEPIDSIVLNEDRRIDDPEQRMSFNFNETDDSNDSSFRGSRCEKVVRSIGEIIVPITFKPSTEAWRRETTSLMGIHQLSFLDHRSSLTASLNSSTMTSTSLTQSMRQTTRL